VAPRFLSARHYTISWLVGQITARNLYGPIPMDTALQSVNSTRLDKNPELCYTLKASCVMQTSVSVKGQVIADKPEESSMVR
jgi:hypothetical protein